MATHAAWGSQPRWRATTCEVCRRGALLARPGLDPFRSGLLQDFRAMRRSATMDFSRSRSLTAPAVWAVATLLGSLSAQAGIRSGLEDEQQSQHPPIELSALSDVLALLDGPVHYDATKQTVLVPVESAAGQEAGAQLQQLMNGLDEGVIPLFLNRLADHQALMVAAQAGVPASKQLLVRQRFTQRGGRALMEQVSPNSLATSLLAEGDFTLYYNSVAEQLLATLGEPRFRSGLETPDRIVEPFGVGTDDAEWVLAQEWSTTVDGTGRFKIFSHTSPNRARLTIVFDTLQPEFPVLAAFELPKPSLEEEERAPQRDEGQDPPDPDPARWSGRTLTVTLFGRPIANDPVRSLNGDAWPFTHAIMLQAFHGDQELKLSQWTLHAGRFLAASDDQPPLTLANGTIPGTALHTHDATTGERKSWGVDVTAWPEFLFDYLGAM